MSTYNITIDGYESGLTEDVVEAIVRDSFPQVENIDVSEDEDV